MVEKYIFVNIIEVDPRVFKIKKESHRWYRVEAQISLIQIIALLLLQINCFTKANCYPKLLKTCTKLKLYLFGFRKSNKIGMDLQSPCVECGTSMLLKLTYYYSYVSNKTSMMLMEVQITIQGVIFQCKNSNYIDGK